MVPRFRQNIAMIFHLLRQLRCSLERLLSGIQLKREQVRVLEEILAAEREELAILRRLEHGLFHSTAGIRVHFTKPGSPGDFPVMASVTLLVGQSTHATIVPFEADGITQTPGAVVSAQSFSVTGEAVTLVANEDGTVTITAVTATTDDLVGSASATVTDADGTAAPFSTTFTIAVFSTTPPPPPPGRTASIGVTFSTPA